LVIFLFIDVCMRKLECNECMLDDWSLFAVFIQLTETEIEK